MYDPVFGFSVEFIGALMVWLFKGCKRKLSDEMAGPHESNNKTWRNFAISSLVFVVIFAVLDKLWEIKSAV